MKKLISSTPAKITAFLLSLITVILFVFSASTTLLMFEYQFYFSDEKTVKFEILTDMASREGEYISQRLEYYNNIKDYYKNKNVYFEIINTEGELLESNYKGEKYVAFSTVEHYARAELPTKDEYGNTHYEWLHVADINVYIPENMKHNDIFSLASKIVHIGFELQYFMIVIAVLTFGISVALISYLFCASGHTSDGMKLNYLDRLPLDIFIFFLVILGLCNAFVFSKLTSDFIPTVSILAVLGSFDYCILLGFFLSVATRIKMGTLFKNTLIFRILKCIKHTFKAPLKYLKYTLSNLSLVKKTILLILLISVFEFLFIFYSFAMIRSYMWEGVIIPVALLSIGGFILMLYLAKTLQKIKSGGEEITGGNLNHKIDTSYMFGEFKEFSENINNINSALQNALEERMKSEHFRVELITNVSHDIKTPLTSIINYVDLIKKEDIDNPAVKEYVDVLDRHSARLKKLVEDLVEASKASSGNLSVELCPCNVAVLLNQAIGEFEERLRNYDLTPIIKLQRDNIIISADGRHLWRVFDNLLSNICKYAMAGTRVYITVTDNTQRTEITFKNISKYELNADTQELMERFVRGDKSRHTEGHGLGLSIAESLLRLQGGRLEISADGDLFKASIIFEK